MSVADTISRPYAQAIFETAVQNNSIKEWKKDLIFINTVVSYKKVRKFLSGSLSPKYLSLVLIEISSDIINEHTKNLIKLLSENQRLLILNNILEQFLKLEAEYKNIIIVELTTAMPLIEKQISKIQKKLEFFLSRKTKITCKIDSQILNGMIIKMNDTVLDLSIQNHLKQLSYALKI